MVSYCKFIRGNEIYLVIAEKELGDPSISKLKEIIECNKDASKIYVITKSVSLNIANYLRNSKAIVIDNIPFDKEEKVIEKLAKEYGLKEINSLLIKYKNDRNNSRNSDCRSFDIHFN